MSTATEEAAARFGTPYQAGVIVEEVVADSALDGVIAPGSIIFRVADYHVSSVEQFLGLLAGYDLRQGPTVTVLDPSGQSFQIRLRVE